MPHRAFLSNTRLLDTRRAEQGPLVLSPIALLNPKSSSLFCSDLRAFAIGHWVSKSSHPYDASVVVNFSDGAAPWWYRTWGPVKGLTSHGFLKLSARNRMNSGKWLDASLLSFDGNTVLGHKDLKLKVWHGITWNTWNHPGLADSPWWFHSQRLYATRNSRKSEDLDLDSKGQKI